MTSGKVYSRVPKRYWPEDFPADLKKRVRQACTGWIDDEDLFVLLLDERCKERIERAYNNARTGEFKASRVNYFVDFLRTKLDDGGQSLPDEWVVKMFGFDLLTASNRKPMRPSLVNSVED